MTPTPFGAVIWMRNLPRAGPHQTTQSMTSACAEESEAAALQSAANPGRRGMALSPNEKADDGKAAKIDRMPARIQIFLCRLTAAPKSQETGGRASVQGRLASI